MANIKTDDLRSAVKSESKTDEMPIKHKLIPAPAESLNPSYNASKWSRIGSIIGLVIIVMMIAWLLFN